MTGLELKLARVAARVKGTEVARAMGVGSTRISHIENSAVVTAQLAERYLAALDVCIRSRSRTAA